MRRWAVVLSAVTISLGAATTVAGTAANATNDNDPYTLSNGNAAPMAGVVYARGDSHAARPSGGGSSPVLLYHSGPVRATTTTVVPIFWGTSWTSTTDKVTALAQFYNGIGGSSYLNTTTEYTQTGGAHVSDLVSYGVPIIDNSPAPSHAPQTSTIFAEVAKWVPNPDPNTYYPVYIDQPRGHAGYCAWHSYGAYNGKNYTIGFFFNLDGDPGCDPGTGGNGEPSSIVPLANVSGHELSEMVTDVQLNAWYDSSGAENADKCAWTFPADSSQWPRFGNATWKIQGNWSNNAYNKVSTYNAYDGGGCIDTH